MIVYIIGTLTSMLFAYASTHILNSRQISTASKKLNAKLFALLSFLPLTFIMAVRYNVGTDFRNYQRIYIYNESVSEVGLSWLNSILHNISDDPQFFFIVSSIIICVGYYIAIYRESVSFAYSILLFVIVKDYFISMNAVRQYIALSVVLFSIPYIKNKDYIKSLLLVIVAMLFHRSAIIIVPLIILYNLEIKPLIGIGIIAGTYVSSALLRRFILPILIRFEFYNAYFSSTYANVDQIFNWQTMLVYIGPFIVLCFIYNKVTKNKNLKLLYSAVLLSLIIMSLSSVMPTLITRLVWYMNAFIVLYLPEAMQAIDDKRVRMFANAAAVILYIIVAYRNIEGGAQNALPYRTFWSK